MKKITLAFAITIALTGCQATQRQDATTGQYETNATTKGAVGGAAAGALIGAIAGDGKGALIGAAAGALIGGGIGHHVDNQEQEFRQHLLNTGVQVKRVGDNQLVLILAKGIGFSTGSFYPQVAIYPTLDSIVEVLNKYPESNIIVNGYTDSVGSAESNQILSEKRAESIKNYFIGQGLAANRAVSRGFGERNPICTNDTTEGRTCNRRVEITITTPQQ
ncbi:OmpA family protein [Vibrio sp. SS-MA-C1-2]|uniref:OmpA family protein n=1 Tax=Vibrio sp. SS-MA-C1-2 TaxID=2908646 RepID=UPI001F3E8EFF|nr:OmpA family protein [Vibrio sp. SS-MA-C1-2]UJF16828.1 OmpA family protein [Vibrio sp. SS-MA-C1-2]